MLFPLLYGFGLIGMSWWSERQEPQAHEMIFTRLLGEPVPGAIPPRRLTYEPRIPHGHGQGFDFLNGYATITTTDLGQVDPDTNQVQYMRSVSSTQLRDEFLHDIITFNHAAVQQVVSDVVAAAKATENPTEDQYLNFTQIVIDLAPVRGDKSLEMLRELVRSREWAVEMREDEHVHRVTRYVNGSITSPLPNYYPPERTATRRRPSRRLGWDYPGRD